MIKYAGLDILLFKEYQTHPSFIYILFFIVNIVVVATYYNIIIQVNQIAILLVQAILQRFVVGIWCLVFITLVRNFMFFQGNFIFRDKNIFSKGLTCNTTTCSLLQHYGICKNLNNGIILCSCPSQYEGNLCQYGIFLDIYI